jgi:homospermidine synthase
MDNQIQNANQIHVVDQGMKIVFLGCGAVAKCVIFHLSDFLKVNYENVYIIDIADVTKHPAVNETIQKGANFMRMKVTEDEYEDLFKVLKLKPLDMVVDLLVSSNYLKMVEVCRKLSLVHVNASLELDLVDCENMSLYDQSILKRHDVLDELNARIKNTDPLNATHIFEFGMNPGIISHFALKGILDVSKLVLKNKEDPELAGYLKNREFAKMAKHLGVEVIHISEIDNQVGKIDVEDDMFVNTWSCIGFLDEGLKPPEIGWGTHEKKLPSYGHLIGSNQVALSVPSYKSLQRSYVPDEEFVGMSIPHGECITIPRFLTLPDYAPTVQYVYRLCPQTRACLERMPFEELLSCKKFKVMEPATCELEGNDRVGALLILKQNPITGEQKNWTHWTGSILGQKTDKYFGPTVIQVATGVLCAIKYAAINPQNGSGYSESLDSEWVVQTAAPFMGQIISEPMPWSPESTQFLDLQVKEKTAHTETIVGKADKKIITENGDSSDESEQSTTSDITDGEGTKKETLELSISDNILSPEKAMLNSPEKAN